MFLEEKVATLIARRLSCFRRQCDIVTSL